MTSEEINKIHAMTAEAMRTRLPADLARAALRYEALRKLNPRQFKAFYLRNLTGNWFDDLVDELVLEHART